MTKIEDYRNLIKYIAEEYRIDIGVLVVNSKFNLMSPFKDLVYEKEL